MRIEGLELGQGYVETVVIPRGGVNVVFKAEAVLSFKEFEELCPPPKPREGQRRNKATNVMEDFVDTTDPKYTTALHTWALTRTDWMVVQALRATPGLTWDTVVPTEPDTWGNYKDELIESGFSEMHIGKILDAVITASGLDEAKIEKATKDFLASAVEEAAAQSTPDTEPETTESGEPAKE